ncbi:hypothetical protein TNCV_3435051 [Trichonephila clavipes]|nr:hypothetical protein TNCV_3435051 [Trichonephila clavipes]
MFFLRNHKNCSNERPPAKMQASHRRPEGLSNISKSPGHPPNIACYDGNPCNQALVGVDGNCVNKSLHMAPEEEI